MGFLLFLLREEESPSLMLLFGNREGCLKIKVFLPMSSFHQFLGLVTQPQMDFIVEEYHIHSLPTLPLVHLVLSPQQQGLYYGVIYIGKKEGD